MIQPPYRIEYGRHDQAAARAVVLRRSGLPSGPLWEDGEVRRPSDAELQRPACSKIVCLVAAEMSACGIADP